MKKIFFICAVTIIFLFAAKKARAMAVTVPSTFSTSNSFINDEVKSITVTVDTTSSGSAYLRPVFFQPGTSSYFGCAQGLNVGTFVCSSTPQDYPQINGSGTFTFSVKPDAGSTLYQQSANSDVSFKVRRCTDSGCAGGDSDSNVVTVHFVTTTPNPTSTPLPTVAPTPSPTPVPQPGNIWLSEFVACPSSGSEWVELYNGNDNTVTLSGWKIKDNIDSHSMAVNDTIDGKKYKAFDISGFSLNNNGDNVRLYDGAGSFIDSRSFSVCDSSQSWAKKSDGSWAQTPFITKGDANRFPTPTPTPSPTPKPTPTPTPSPDPTAMEGADLPAGRQGILGESTTSGTTISLGSDDPTASPTSSVSASTSSRNSSSNLFAYGAIGLGLTSIVGLLGYLGFEEWKKRRRGAV